MGVITAVVDAVVVVLALIGVFVIFYIFWDGLLILNGKPAAAKRNSGRTSPTRGSEGMTAVGFEPTQLALVELESTPLAHSGKLS